MKDRSYGQTEIIQVAVAAGNLAIDYSNGKKLASLQRSFQRQLDSDAAKIDYTKDIVQRFKIAAQTLAHTGRISPDNSLFDKYLSLIVKDDMQYSGGCNVALYQPAQSYKTPWITINNIGALQPYTNAPPDVGSIWVAGCHEAKDLANVDYIQVLKGQSIAGGLWTGLRGRIQQITRADIGAIDLFMRIGMGIFIIVSLVLILKVQSALIEEQSTVKYVRKPRNAPRASKVPRTQKK